MPTIDSRTIPPNMQNYCFFILTGFYIIAILSKKYKQHVTHLYLSSEVKCAFPGVYEALPLLHIYQ